MSVWSIITLVGYCLEIVGVIMMANRFKGVDLLSLIVGLVLSPFKTNFSNVIARISKGESDDPYLIFRGLGFLGWGFSLQFISFIATL
ncbi:hypothetical protein DS901_09065 [Loktanella sp. D2R18]|uniref:hypothetical protein n=1 Tax=Rhodobacterales TaxID=204455 RepID=UPI000DEA9F53|nr:MULTISPECIES: hypothetical protein [Rhodobacterales]MDO6591494.1 hypothetical protein [Yoonia sp. 1_MG-2023]RBW43870.1 hypothetical protein DS901_09065 [Loktanella sp. D2R18]